MLGKKKQLEETVRQLTEKLEEQEKSIAQLSESLENYKNKERIIVGAMTRAQSDAVKIVEEAEREKCLIVEQAIEDRRQAEKEAEEIINKAKAEAQRIKAEADDYSKDKVVKADAFMENYRENAKKLNMALRKAAEDAAARAEQFRAYFGGANVDNEIELAEEYCGISKAEEVVEDLPEDYETPAQLMQNIYRIENRNTAWTEIEKEEAQDRPNDESKWNNAEETCDGSNGKACDEEFMTVDDIMAESSMQQENEQEEKSEFEKRIDDELNAIIDELLKEEVRQ